MSTTREQASGRRPRARKPAAKRARFAARLSPEQKELFEHAAALYGQPVSQFVITSAQRAAEQAIREHEVVTLSLRDSQHFASIMLNPPEPNERLRAAMRRQMEEVEDGPGV